MFYHGKLLNGSNVIKNEFRPAYLNGSNTEKLPVESLENSRDNVEGPRVSSFSTTSSSALSSSGNPISSFQETLNRMKNAANDKIQKDNEDKERETDEKKFSNVTLKPFMFFDLLTSKDSSSQSREVSQSLSNIGEIYVFVLYCHFLLFNPLISFSYCLIFFIYFYHHFLSYILSELPLK